MTPARPRQEPTRCSKENPIGRRQLRSTCLPTKHRELMPEHDDLELLEALRTRRSSDDLEHAAQRQVADDQNKNDSSDQRDGERLTAHLLIARTELTHPTGSGKDGFMAWLCGL